MPNLGRYFGVDRHEAASLQVWARLATNNNTSYAADNAYCCHMSPQPEPPPHARLRHAGLPVWEGNIGVLGCILREMMANGTCDDGDGDD